MSYNQCQNSFTLDQLSRCHLFLTANQWVLHSGQTLPPTVQADIDGDPYQCPANQVYEVDSDNATITINNLPSATFTWVKTSGSGTFSPQQNGRVVQLFNLGNINLTLTYWENCQPYEKYFSVKKALGPAFRPSNDQILISMEGNDRLGVDEDDQSVISIDSSYSSLSVFDADQRIVYTSDNIASNSSGTVILTEGWPPGDYTLQFFSVDTHTSYTIQIP